MCQAYGASESGRARRRRGDGGTLLAPNLRKCLSWPGAEVSVWFVVPDVLGCQRSRAASLLSMKTGQDAHALSLLSVTAGGLARTAPLVCLR